MANLPLARKAATASGSSWILPRPSSSSPTRASSTWTRESLAAVSIPSSTSRRVGSAPTNSRSKRSPSQPSASPWVRSRFKMMWSAREVIRGLRPVTNSARPPMSSTVKKPTVAKKPIIRRRMLSNFSDQRAMTEQVIGENACDHRFAHRNRPDADAGVVPARGRDLDLVAFNIDGAQRIEDRACRLDRKSGDDLLTSGDAAKNASGVVRQEHNAAILHPHLVGVLLPSELCRSEACTDLDTFDCVDRHQCAGKISIKLVVDRFPKPCRHSTRDDLYDGAGRGAGFSDAIEIISPEERPRCVGAPEGVALDGPPVPGAAVDRVWADLDQSTADRHAGTKDLARDRARSNARGGLARRSAAAAAIVAHAIFLPVSIVSVARAEAVGDVTIVLRPLICVLDQELERGAGRHAVEHTAEDLDQILLAPLGGKARLSRFALVEPVLDVGLGEREARRHPVDDDANRRPVALAPGGEAEQGAERGPRHRFNNPGCAGMTKHLPSFAYTLT